MADLFDQYAHQRPNVNPTIYVYKDRAFPGYLKVGYTGRTAQKRIDEIHSVATPDVPYEILHYESAFKADGSSFMDHDVHRVLERKGFRAARDKDGKKTEFFKCSLSDVKSAILAVKTGTENAENRTETFGMRPEQKQAVELTEKYFLSEKKASSNRSPKFLWNCKMRFGKTFATYQLAKAMGMKKILILTFKPAVEESWETDLMTHMDFEGWQFYSRNTEGTPDDLDQSRPIVCFGSFQDFLGTNDMGGIKAKNEWVHATNWDMVVFDEYHFGAWRENAKRLFDKQDDEAYYDTDTEKYVKEEWANAINESFLPITTDYYLYLSGTPFRSLNTGEFTEDQIFSWTYSDEQNAKETWDEKDGANPYLPLPKMVMMTYKMPKEIQEIALEGEFNEFDLNVFFSASTPDKRHPEQAQFVYKDHVQKWLDLIRGSYTPTIKENLQEGINSRQKPIMPFSDTRMLSLLNHTIWFLPNVASCHAMANLLRERQNSFYNQSYHINVAAGASAGVGLDALPPVRDSMNPPLETKSITLTCGKLTTGVTVKPWTGIFMLRTLNSPETYFQSAFRVQSPWTVKNDTGKIEIIKKECFVFDFDINRALRQLAEYSSQLNVGNGTTNQEQQLGDFIHFLPVIAYDGSAMAPVNAEDILEFVTSGTTATMLARRWESATLVKVDNETLKRLMDNPDALKAIMNIEAFRSLGQDIETIINKSNAVKKAKREGGNLTPKQKKQLTEAEKEYKSKRKEIQEKLIHFATRIPVFMYLTDAREKSLKEVILQIESDLFKRVTGITIPEFKLLTDIGMFDTDKMNDAVWRFKRYEDASLEYTGINRHADDTEIGLFDKTITRAEYESKKVAEEPEYVDATTNTFTYVPPAQEAKPVEQETEPSKKEIVSLCVGDKVNHKKFGKGIVTSVEKGKQFNVDFESGGSKMLIWGVFDMGIVQKV